MHKLIGVFILIVLLSACAEPYSKKLSPRAAHGYSETELTPNGVFLLKYEGTTRQNFELIETYWQQRAQELCPNGYTTTGKRQEKKRGTIETPVNGILVNVGTWTPVVVGTIQCEMG